MPYDGDINLINSADIESMTVLKDAASNALYGARGANGVIMITTKRGQSGHAKVTFDAKWGLNQNGLPHYETVNTQQFYELYYQMLYNNYSGDPGRQPHFHRRKPMPRPIPVLSRVPPPASDRATWFIRSRPARISSFRAVR